jgi:hypothetical protein
MAGEGLQAVHNGRKIIVALLAAEKVGADAL